MTKANEDIGLPLHNGSENVKFVPLSKPDTNVELLYLVERYQRKELIPPPHQRTADAWNMKKRLDWIDRCRKTLEGLPAPLGIVCIYSLTTERCEKEYLNEGLQRISSSLLALREPSQFNFNERTIKTILQQTTIHVQHRMYATHAQASEDFVLVNHGTLLEPAEKHHHLLVYSEKWDIWESEIDRWRVAIERTVFGWTNSTERRPDVLMRKRMNYQLFCIAHEQRPKSFGNKDQLERILVDCIKNSNSEIVSGHIKRLEAYGAEILHAWRKHCEKDGQGGITRNMQEGLARWCLGIMFLYRDMWTPDNWQCFFAKLLAKTNGTATLNYIDEHEKPKHISLARKLGGFNTVCKQIGIEPPTERPERAKTPLHKTLRPGYHADHIDSFVDNGEGGLAPLPGALNAAKNARTPHD
jgi:hypothetical protein